MERKLDREKLTDSKLMRLKPAEAGGRYIVWDSEVAKFGARVTDKGSVSFVVAARRKGRANPEWKIVGKWPREASKEKRDKALRDARKLAGEVLALFEEGRHPDEVAAEQKAEEEAQAAVKRAAEAKRQKETFGAAVETFVTTELDSLRSGSQTESTLRREFLGQVRERMPEGKRWAEGESIWRDRPISEIRRRDVISRLDIIKRERGLFAAREALAALRKLFNWIAEGERYGVEVSPCSKITEKTIGFSKDKRELRRTRVLSDAELRKVWEAAPAWVRLLMLSGQREGDIVSAQWSEIDLDGAMLVVPPERYKTATAHEVPLTPRAIEILKELRPEKPHGFVFTSTGGKRPVGNISQVKANIDGASGVKNWKFHDLRRTVRTRLVSDVGADAYIAERVIGHALPGLHKVYDQGTHRAQKRAALEAWEEKLLSIVEPPPSPETAEAPGENVVQMRRKGGRA